MVTPQTTRQLAKARPAPVFFRGAVATTALAAGAFAVSLVVGIAGGGGSQSQQSLAASSAQDATNSKVDVPNADTTNRSANPGAAQEAPKFATTATPFIVPTATMPPVSGASAGGGTSELGRPATPEAATGAQPPASARAVPSSAATAKASTDILRTNGTIAPQSLPISGQPKEELSADIVRPDGRNETDNRPLRVIQFALGAVTVTALSITVIATRWRGRSNIS